MTIYIGWLIVDDPIVMKLNSKHHVTRAELQQSVQWPARVEVIYEEHPEHGGRWIVWATTSEGRAIVAWLLPSPAWEGDQAESWVVKTARWV